MKVKTEKIKEGDHNVSVNLIEIDNAILAFYSTTDNPKLGTLAIAIPQPKGQNSLSSVLLGERNSIITKILAERLSQNFNKITLVSTHLEEIRDNQFRRILQLTQQLYTHEASS